MGGSMSRASTANNLKHCTLWKADRSPACRAVMMALDAMNLNVTEVDVNMDKGEHRCIEIVTMNPQVTLPILKDRELILCDSNAITTYIASRYCTKAAEKLYPSDPGARALVNQYMHFNTGIVYPRYREVADPILYKDVRCIATPCICHIECAYFDMEKILTERPYLGGIWPSLADIMTAASLSTLNILVPIDAGKYPKTCTWLFRMSEERYFITANKKGLCEFARRIGKLIIEKSKF